MSNIYQKSHRLRSEKKMKVEVTIKDSDRKLLEVLSELKNKNVKELIEGEIKKTVKFYKKEITSLLF